ncbi:LapA family protein [bacterium]|nr:LapA family protein [candidate division CSSED10-310 bacterium]
MKHVKLLLVLILFTILVIFAVSNNNGVAVHFWKTPVLGYHASEPTEEPGRLPSVPAERLPRTLPLFLWVFLTFGVGYLVCWIIGFFELRKLKRRLRMTIKEKDMLASELEELRAKPVMKEPAEEHPDDRGGMVEGAGGQDSRQETA